MCYSLKRQPFALSADGVGLLFAHIAIFHQNARSEQEAATWSLYLVTNWFWLPLCYAHLTYNSDDAEDDTDGDADDDIDYDIDDDTDDDIDDFNNDTDDDIDDSQP